ncbi:SanA/YdcF family protein [Halomonas garicola]|uniref:SanA/YdcF family protein n=1 Tax=Halomonas garicola TaxID=1690008 RepID=UPI002898535C|nr:ElyC/SanA/YdcF family protein [Halomonas garicola]
MMQRLLGGIRQLLMVLGALLLLAVLLLVAGNIWVLTRTAPYIDSRLDSCRAQPVGVVFGTSSWTRTGVRNPHFIARMHTAARLVKNGRVDHLLLSGDNRTRSYNEPRAMWRDLSARGVASQRLTMDFAGFSTFDTLARAQDVFQLERAALITQRWHLPRAIYIARARGMDVTGCVANDGAVEGEWRLRLREGVARVATLGDLYLWAREPYFLGPAEPILPAPATGIPPGADKARLDEALPGERALDAILPQDPEPADILPAPGE